MYKRKPVTERDVKEALECAKAYGYENDLRFRRAYAKMKKKLYNRNYYAKRKSNQL